MSMPDYPVLHQTADRFTVEEEPKANQCRHHDYPSDMFLVFVHGKRLARNWRETLLGLAPGYWPMVSVK